MAKNDKQLGFGVITRIQGPVIDIQFEDDVPGIYEALEIELDKAAPGTNSAHRVMAV